MSYGSLRLVLESTGAAARALRIVATAQAVFPDGQVVVDEALRSIAVALRSASRVLPYMRPPEAPRPPAPPKLTVAALVAEVVEEVYVRPHDPALVTQEINGCKVLLLEVVRRAAYDWVLYRTSRRMLHKKLAEDAYTWLFEEGPGHPNWIERERTGKFITSFIAICNELDLDADTVRSYVRKLTVKNVMSVGRPAEYRRRSTCPPSMDEEHVPTLSAGSWLAIEGEFGRNDSDH
jgi:hypothetical protein